MPHHSAPEWADDAAPDPAGGRALRHVCDHGRSSAHSVGPHRPHGFATHFATQTERGPLLPAYDHTDLTRTVRANIHLCGCGCWVWTGSCDTSGYAKFKLRGRTIPTHRYVYEHFLGPLDELTVDHTCDRHRNCLNPAHFEAVTRSENSIRANQRRFHDPDPDRSACTPFSD